MTTITREKEQKFEAPPGVVLPTLTDLPRVAAQSRPETEKLTAEYYDTIDLRLLKARITLRRREGGTDEGWHLKLPDGTARREVRTPLDRSGDPAPDELTRLVRAHTRDEALRPVARIETLRRKTTLSDPAGTSLAEVVTDEVAAQTLGASATTVSRWDEIEVELTGGSEKLLRAVGKRLRHAGLRTAGYGAKLERALGAEPPSRPELSSHSTAGEVVLAYLYAQATRLKSLDPAVRRDEPDSVHQMRVATRRLRSTLQSFPAILHKPAVKHLRGELKWLGGVLGDAREAEVLSERLLAALATMPTELVMGPVEARVRVHFAPREADARTAVTSALDSGRYFALLEALDGLIAEPPLTAKAALPARDVLSKSVRRAGGRTRRRIRRALRTPAGRDHDAALHEVRKAARRARYAAEAAKPVLGRRARQFAKRMKAVQSILGDQHDAVNARAATREIGVHAHLAGENAFSFGLLHEQAHRDAREYQREARRVWTRGSGWLLGRVRGRAACVTTAYRMPPATSCTSPVTYEDASLAR
jgi:CHAD domain-containing protein/DNA-binding transcriptional regulator YiaG